jgi:hypothetical protein
MLAGDEQARIFAKRGERMCDGTELDCFGTRSDDERDT